MTYHYLQSCADSDAELVWDAQDLSSEITYAEFIKNVDLEEVKDLFHWYDWEGCGLQLEDDVIAASYHESAYRGDPCYYICHLGIEYFFTEEI